MIELRIYIRSGESGHCQNFLEFFHQSPGSICHLNQHQLQEKLKAGDAVVMFDGLDEIFDSGKREDVITAIHRFTNEYPRVRVIVTSRIIGYKPKRLQDAEFHHFILQDLNPAQIQDFVHRWHELTFTDAREKVRICDRMKRALEYSSTIRDLAGNPLLLTIMAILNRSQELPRDRAELYNQASRILLYQWDVERSLVEDSRLDPKTIDAKDKQEMLRRVAWKMQAAPEGLAGNIISAEDLEDILTAYLKNKDFDQPRNRAKLIVNQLRTRNFILCDLGADSYGFIHRSFLEYFCASQVVNRVQALELSLDELKAEVFGPHWDDESWQEVLCLIAGLIAGKLTGEVIQFLIEQDGEVQKFTNLFLAAKCLDEVRDRKVIAAVDSQLLERLKELTKYDLNYSYEPYGEEADLVEKIRTQAVSAIAFTWKEDPETLPWFKQLAQSDDDSAVRRAAVQELARGWKDDPETLTILNEIAEHDDNLGMQVTAVQELLRGWKIDFKILSWLKDVVRFNDDPNQRSSAVQELARGCKDDPGTLPWLKTMAQSYDDWNVQKKAFQELVRGWKHKPEILPWFKQITQSNNYSDVRSSAVEELARGWKHDPETLPWLKQLAQSNDDSIVRRAAVEELARRWKDDPKTLPWLKQLAQSDDGLIVRRAAVEELARGWTDDPETLPWLKQRAQSDDDWDVRSSAVEELARRWKDDPETFELLCDIAINHPCERMFDFQDNPRKIALEIMFKQYPDRPKTLEILRDRFANDPDEQVREFAEKQLAKLDKL
ncbi:MULTISPECIES: HEAT repeat domain-containing protein [unclassified Tychonema]|uniref:HEAT repeat domain-containing protein n=1 Tax=unclassified Tychonema TaxID=2642144 RepID=UPI001D144601|nr:MULTISPECIES: HEAT repeat domain-containing protein [unclassified Tychonema]